MVHLNSLEKHRHNSSIRIQRCFRAVLWLALLPTNEKVLFLIPAGPFLCAVCMCGFSLGPPAQSENMLHKVLDVSKLSLRCECVDWQPVQH